MLARALGALGRAAPPAIPLERLVRRAALRRRLVVAGSLGAVAAVVLVALVFFPRAPRPPVHLQVEFIDLPASEAADAPVSQESPLEMVGP